MAEMTPLMRQYWEMKSLHKDKILLFRMGDFYEMFFDDAVTAAPILGIALTSRNKKSADETPMCGMPHHSVAGPISKLLAQGLKVAICDQIEDPKFAKGIVKRAVTRVLTPGMVLDPETLETSRSHYIACAEEGVLACIDATTGESFYFEPQDPAELERLLSVLPIAELVQDPENPESRTGQGFVLSRGPELADESQPLLADGANAKKAARRLLAYVLGLGGTQTQLILKAFERRALQGRMVLTPTTLRHLEIFTTSIGDPQGSFFQAMNRTQSSLGARLLRQWLCFPLIDLEDIKRRQDEVELWTRDAGKLQSLRQILRGMGDLERRLSKAGQPSCGGRDLLQVRDAARAALQALRVAGKSTKVFGDLEALTEEIEGTLVEDPPLQVRQGHMIRGGYSKELDELIVLSTDSQSLLEQMEAREKAATGIASLKIRYNQVFGYYIEITNTHKEKAPAHYMRKQTLANAERYCTDELVELEKKVLSAQSRRNDLEYEIFETLRRKVLKASMPLLQLASVTAELDVVTSFAWLAIERRYCRPILGTSHIRLEASRHSVVEQKVKDFVANTIEIHPGGCLLLTGPNMAGKSTIMRQVALTALLAQVGSFVPADRAELPLFDQIFTRIGANDQLNEGLSTFMVEMTETSEILRKMTSKSLVILDEIGRGTSTFDGMSLAQAILEFLVEKKKSITMFATHYHELTALEARYPVLRNAHMSVVEKGGEIRFLHTLTKGPALKSYGIQVAKLAGLPAEVTQRAAQVLKKIESPLNAAPAPQMSLFDAPVAVVTEVMEQVEPLKAPFGELLEGIREWPLQKKTPLEALNQIKQWQDQISSQSSDSNH